jgi:hypothetical protein
MRDTAIKKLVASGNMALLLAAEVYDIVAESVADEVRDRLAITAVFPEPAHAMS